MNWKKLEKIFLVIFISTFFIFSCFPTRGSIGPLKFPLNSYIVISRCDMPIYIVVIYDLRIQWDRAHNVTEEDKNFYKNRSIQYSFNDPIGCE